MEFGGALMFVAVMISTSAGTDPGAASGAVFGAIVGAIAVLLGGLLNYFTQAKVQKRQLKVLREGQITDLITRAIDQLGSDKTDVRLGGVWALERLVESSPDEWRLLSAVLTAYVQNHAPWPPRADRQPPETTPRGQLPPLRSWAPDVQAVLTVLARRGGWPGEQLNLVSVDLRMAELTEAKLEEAVLRGSCLQRAILHKADLQGAIFSRSLMQGADLRDAHLEHATLSRSQLDEADLGGAYLEGARIIRFTDLRNAILKGAYLSGATATRDTTWPPGFEVSMHGVVIED
jgi:hypothetical protein